MDTENIKRKLTFYFTGSSGFCIYDWKRLARNIEFDDEDMGRLYRKCSDIDKMIFEIDNTNVRVLDKCYKMLVELESVKGGELWWSKLKPALKSIGKGDCVHIGK